MRKFFVLLMILSMAFVAFSANQLEIFSWWTGGGEEEGLLALFDVFHKYYPDVEIINATVAGGAGTNAKAVLKTRMLGGEPTRFFPGPRWYGTYRYLCGYRNDGTDN